MASSLGRGRPPSFLLDPDRLQQVGQLAGTSRMSLRVPAPSPQLTSVKSPSRKRLGRHSGRRGQKWGHVGVLGIPCEYPSDPPRYAIYLPLM
jgi:hypothetical protein